MVIERNYIDTNTFKEFKENQITLIQILNHNMTELKDDVKCQTKDISSIAKCVAKMEGSYTTTKRIIWWMMGVFAGLISLTIIGALLS